MNDSDGRQTGRVRALSLAQQRLWFLDRLRPGSPDYLLPMAARVKGDLDEAALIGAFGDVLTRHEVLRTRYEVVDGEPVQRVAPHAHVPVTRHDLPSGASDEEMAALMERELCLPFDLARDLPLRLVIAKLADDDRLLLIVVHHIAFDGLSWDVLSRDLTAGYAARVSASDSDDDCDSPGNDEGDGNGESATVQPTPAMQYADFAEWQRERLAGPRLARHLDYWSERLAGLAPLELPTDRPRPAVWDGRGDVVRFELPPDLVAEVGQFARRHRVTPFMVLLAVFQTLLARSTGRTDVAVGTPVAGRTRPEAERLIGLFVNSVVLRTDLSGRPSFGELLTRVRATALGAFSHAEAPFERVVDALSPARDLSRNPLYQVSFSLRGTPSEPLALPGLGVAVVRPPLTGSPFDLGLDMNAWADGSMSARLQYATALFDRPTVQRLAVAYQAALRAVLADPDRPVHHLDLLSPDDRRDLLVAFNDTAEPMPSACVHELFAEQARRTPDAVAVRGPADELTYRRLDERADRLARRLRAHGAGPETLVGVCLRRSPDLVVALLAVLKAGAAYLPLDPAHPAARRSRLLATSGARLLVAGDGLAPEPGEWDGCVVAVADGSADPDPTYAATHTATHTAPHAALHKTPPADDASPDNLAYVIYTSGSTGEPKGVAVTHRNLVNYVTWAARRYETHGAGTPLYSPVAFDLPVTSIFPALLSGAAVTVTADGGSGLDDLVALLGRDGFDALKTTPAHLALLGQALPPAALRTAAPRLVVGGEPFTDALFEPWRRHAPDTVVVNEYGPTEATVGCALLARRVSELPPGPVPIGTPVPNTTLYVLDDDLRPVLPGSVGGLYIGGAQVARGYHGRGDLTADRFIPDPFAAAPGARLYRTGDLVRHRSDGELEFLGRADGQVKVRGFRIEPAEVEAALAAHPAVRDAAVVAHGAGADARLAAYFVPAGGGAPGLDELRDHAARTLPDYMVPALYVPLPEIPLTPSGKIDRRALPDPLVHRMRPLAELVAPRTPVERAVAELWEEMLGVADVGAHGDFFSLGGNSMDAIRIAFRLRDRFGVDLPLADVFAARTVARLAEAVERAGRDTPIEPVPHDAPLPLSSAQRSLWFLDRLTPGATDYLVPIALRLRGSLDAAALRRALDTVAGRHAVLRTRYVERDGEPFQVIDPEGRVPLRHVDLSTLPPERREPEALRLVREDLGRPFDLAADLPARATLIRLAAEDHLFLLTLHHITSDAWSAGILADELTRAYAGDEPLAPLPVQYADYAVWQRENARGERFEAHVAHWRDRLAGLPPLDLPTDRRRPRVRDTRGDRLAVELPAALGHEADELARRHGATPFMVLLAAFYALLGRYTGQHDIAVGTPSAGRSRPETRDLVGFFATTLVLRGDLRGQPSFGTLLDRVRDRAVDAYAHADVPFDRVVEELAPERDPSRNPLFQVMFELQPPPAGAFAPPGLDVEPLPVAWPIAKFDLMLSVRPQPDGALRCGFEYATALFDRAAVARMADHYRRILAAALADADRPLGALDLLGPEEHARLAAGWEETAALRPQECLPDLIAAQAARTPAATAVVYGTAPSADTLTYADLHDRADRLARRLRELGVRPETPVAVALRRDADLVTALLAVLRAGGVYVPVDPDQPLARRAYVLRDSGAAVLISQSWIRAQAPDPELPLLLLDEEPAADLPPGDQAPLPALDPANAAYVVYTSGSTGRPKGVAVSHEAIRNRVLWTVREHGLGPGDRVLQKTTVGFDAAMWEFLAPLVSGGTVVVAADGVPRDTAAMVRAVAEHRVTVLQLVPSVLRMLVAEPGLRDCATLRLVFCAGEPLPAELCDRLRSQVAVDLVNTYGPTECAIDVTAWPYMGDEPGEIVAIGRPVDNTRVLVLDPAGRPVPLGVAGELCVAGVQLARGYVGRGDLTAEKFVPHPFPRVPGERMYRTGDRVRRRGDGVLEFLGRLDRQVKLRGVRIEPGEIEAALCEHPGIAAAAVGVYDAARGDQRLVAHVVAAAGAQPDPERLRVHLAERLPAAMVPSVLRTLPALPVTPSGKIDRAALPGLAGLSAEADGGAPYAAPSGPTQTGVAAAFAGLLGAQRVGAHDDFFALGGHSLLATRLVFRLRAAFGIDVPVAEIFARRTVARLAELLDSPDALPSDDAGPVLPVPRRETMPPSSAQQRMWFLDRLEPGSADYLVPLVLRLTGPLDAASLTGALDDLAARHEVLRTRYIDRDGAPLQLIDPPSSLGAVTVDLTGLPRPDAAERAAELVRAEAVRPFVLDAEWPLRAFLVRIAADECLLALTAHHIAVDGWTMDVLTRDLRELYRARLDGTPTPLPPVQYADFAAWQERWSRGPRAEADLAFWRDRLAGLTPLELTTDRPRPAVRDPHGDLVAVDLPDELAEAVGELAARHAVTPFVVLFAAFGAVLARYTGQTDIAVGTPVAGRTRPETEDVAGLFSNTVVLRVDLAGDPAFAELLDRARDCVVSAYSHQDLPFERLVDELRPERDLARNPLFQLMFEFQHAPSPTPRLEGVAVQRVPSPWHTAKFDLTLSLARRADGGVRGLLEYATALFDRATVERLAGHYLHLLREAAAHPEAPLSRLPILTDGERRQLLHTWNQTDAEGAVDTAPDTAPDTASDTSAPEACVPQLFERRAAEHPSAEAVAFGDSSLTYAVLNARANRLAHYLRGLGARPGTAVAVCMERGPEAVTALLAVLKTGAMYVPVDPAHPAQRLAFMLADADALAVVTLDRFAARLADAGRPLVLLDRDAARIATQPAHNPPPQAGPDDLAYMIYTSGSTGKPKGVLIEHRSYAHHCAVIARAYGVGPGERVVLLSALTFDVAMDQIAATLLAGATIVVADPLFWNPAELPDRIAEHGITVMEITPAYYREVMRTVAPGDPRLRGLKLMNVGSDVVTAADARLWTATGLPGRFLCNYGPTEATVTCVLHPLPHGPEPDARAEAALPIGRPVPGTRAYIIDRHGDPVPVGVPGELHLGGIRLARGYHRRAALTAEKFVPDPFGTEPGGRLYRTGDLVQYRADGAIEFLGRIDTQVKLRGLRIELGEIEAVLAGHPDVRAAAVVARDLRPGDRRLVAYVVPADDAAALNPTALRTYVAERLPDYMCPAVWVTLPELPLTSSKKVDRAALPPPSADRPELDRPYVAPRDPAEQTIAALWAEALGVDRVGALDDVFLLGAHSLLVTRVLARVDAAFGVDLPLRTLFEATTVAALAAAVRAAVEDEIARMTDDEVAALLAAPADTGRPTTAPEPSLEDVR
ncbi:MAG TPA: amino acid adenylation domain-containing protein [Actinocrinis sp.]|nr:amino acid adenylation domain-containing protein [Actinocrinis sp.]